MVHIESHILEDVSMETVIVIQRETHLQEGERMKQPKKRVERSLPESGLQDRLSGLLDDFKAEVLERFQEQEEKNAEQDLKIARQSAVISKLEETIAEQQKTIEVQNETIQKIDPHPHSGKTAKLSTESQNDQHRHAHH